jgi:hypothetical protein
VPAIESPAAAMAPKLKISIRMIEIELIAQEDESGGEDSDSRLLIKVDSIKGDESEEGSQEITV